jgi:hypothetical protein
VFYPDLFRCLAQHDVRYVPVGGLAMNLLGVHAFTLMTETPETRARRERLRRGEPIV